MRKIVLFTAYYPYGTGEQFLTLEVRHLSKSFDLVIVPLSSGKTNPRMEAANVRIYPPILPSNIVKRLFNAGLVRLIGFKSLLIIFKELLRTRLHCRRVIHLLRAIDNISNLIGNRSVQMLLESLREEDFIYFYWGHGAAYALPFMTSLNAKKVMRVHGGDLYENIHCNYSPFREIQLETLDWLLPISDHGNQYIRSRYPKSNFRSAVLRLGTVYHDDISKRSVDKIFRIVSCSSLVPEKRVPLIITILNEIQIDLHWIHMGGNKETLHRYSVNRLSNKRVSCTFTGQIPHEEVFKFYKNKPVDLFINVSSSEGVPVSIMEAQSFGIPIICTDVGGTKEIISTESGVVLPKDFDPKMAARIIEDIARGTICFDEKAIKENWYRISSENVCFEKLKSFFLES
ncbi:MAG: putative teichuronic acid biosynthesis glycosyltransferase TuaC [Syntrophorhabdus sp. PtaU1.Bin002]|nr:MAG: putative teichuronic acid biosynthesis glycosyltransferase TuaC [Syntrophorhabdus sp. PtaU1.Bin002]